MHLGYIILCLENILRSMGNLLSQVGNIIMPLENVSQGEGDIITCLKDVFQDEHIVIYYLEYQRIQITPILIDKSTISLPIIHIQLQYYTGVYILVNF
jgi:hypothetical protein